MMRRSAVALATLALAAGLTACGSSGSGGGTSSTASGAGSSSAASSAPAQSGSSGSAASGGSGASAEKAVTVTVKNFAFGPSSVTVAKGGTVTWKFEDNAAHNVTANDGKFKSKTMQTGSYKYTFNTPGTYDYLCTVHQYMKGSVTVK